MAQQSGCTIYIPYYHPSLFVTQEVEVYQFQVSLQEILDTPERLRDLDLEAFSVELERQGYGQKLTTLYDIRAELNSRYKDTRAAFKPCELVERFNMLTKETPATLYIGESQFLCCVYMFYHKLNLTKL